MNKCDKCGGMHYRTDPCRQKRSTAVRKLISPVAKLFSYNDESGELFWLRDYGRAKAGQRAGTDKPSGYRSVQVDGEFYQEHRIIWVLMTGEEIPDGAQIDHINQIKSDNRWINLRLANPAQQQINTKTQANNKHGRGVSWRESNGKWRADIYVDGKSVCLGHYSSKESAQAAYVEGSIKHYGEYAPKALPVDTNSEPGSVATSNPQRLGASTRKDEVSPSPKPKHIDRHRKGYFQEYHAKRRAAIKAGTWKPKRKGDGK